MIKKSIIALLLYICPISWLQGLDSAIPLNQYLMDRWEQSNGLPTNGVKMLAQTPDGYIWIATTRGLTRFDGKTFTLIHFSGQKGATPASGDIPDALYVDRSGALWIGGGAGLTSYHYKKGVFTTYTAENGMTNSRIRRISDDMRGNLWVSFFTGYVNRFANGAFKAYNEKHGLEGQKINAILEDRKGNLIFATREHGFFIFQNEKFHRFPIPAEIGDVQIIHMCEDHAGQLWIGSSKGLFRFFENKLERFSWENGLSNEYITAITEDSDHNLWVGSVKGLNRMRPERNGQVQFESILEDSMITWVMEDAEKNIWVSTYETGVRCFKEPKFFPFTALKGKAGASIGGFCEDPSGDLWVGALNGELFQCSGEDAEKIQLPELADNGIVHLMVSSQSSLWVGTNGRGVFFCEKWPPAGGKFPKPVNLTAEQGLSDNLATCIMEDRQKRIWIGAFDGVSCYDRGKLTSLSSRQGFAAKTVYRIFQDSANRIWISSDKGAWRLENGELSLNALKHVIKDIPVTSVYEDREKGKSGEPVFWITTNGGGLKRMEKEEITSFTAADGLSSDFLHQLLEDEAGSFWITSNQGILRIKKDQLTRRSGAENEPIHCILYDIADGMENKEYFNEFSFALKRRNGQLLFASQNSLSILDPAKIRINKLPPPVIIESVLNGDAPVSIQNGSASTKGATLLTIRFSSPSFLAPDKLRFRFQLEGHDKKWNYLAPGEAREAHYTKLPPGQYRFRVTACNRDGVWNHDGDMVDIHLKPYFYESLIFKLLMGLFIATAAALMFLFMKRKSQAKKARYKTSPLNRHFAEECIAKLKALMTGEKIYRDPELSLQILADKMAVTPHILSQLLNENLDRNFSDYINQFRIEEAKTILRDSRSEDKKIITVAFDVGFNTKVAFYNAFKKYTGMTPSEYKKSGSS